MWPSWTCRFSPLCRAASRSHTWGSACVWHPARATGRLSRNAHVGRPDRDVGMESEASREVPPTEGHLRALSQTGLRRRTLRSGGCRALAQVPSCSRASIRSAEHDPDWAVALQKQEPECERKTRHVYLVAETKGTTVRDDLRPDGRRKITCGSGISKTRSTSPSVPPSQVLTSWGSRAKEPGRTPGRPR